MNAVKLTELFLGELNREAPLTRRVLERVPEGRNEWRPHEKSMPLGRLAALVAGMPAWLAMMIDKSEFDLNPPGGPSGSFQTNIQTNAALLKTMASPTGCRRSRTPMPSTSAMGCRRYRRPGVR